MLSWMRTLVSRGSTSWTKTSSIRRPLTTLYTFRARPPRQFNQLIQFPFKGHCTCCLAQEIGGTLLWTAPDSERVESYGIYLSCLVKQEQFSSDRLLRFSLFFAFSTAFCIGAVFAKATLPRIQESLWAMLAKPAPRGHCLLSSQGVFNTRSIQNLQDRERERERRKTDDPQHLLVAIAVMNCHYFQIKTIPISI